MTGGAGYIGSHAVRALVQDGHEVVVIDNLSKGYRKAVHPKTEFVELDLADSVRLADVFRHHRFDAVMHFAGLIEVGLSMREPGIFFQNNCMNGVNLLEAMRAAGVKNIIFSSTAAVYGNPEKVPIPETAPTSPTNFYGYSKLVFEQILEQYRKFYGLQYVALRYFNACGADPSGEIGQAYAPPTHLIPRVLQSLLGEIHDLKLYGTDYPTADGTCIRDYIHVSDLVDAHLLALQQLLSSQKSDVFNLGNALGFSVRQVLAVIENVTGQKVQISETARREGDSAILVADASKAKNILGWQPKFSGLQEIVGSAWKWHKSHPHGYAN